MAANEVLSQMRGQTLILTFNRPESANAMSVDMATQLHNFLKNATTDRSVRCVLLCGSGSNFMNGMDLSFFKGDFTEALDRANKLIMPYHSAIRELQAMDKPVIAAVEGTVTGAGMSLMLAADIVIAAQSTKFVARFAEVGLSPNGGASYFLPRRVGACRAMEIFMLNEAFDSHYAERLHLVNKVVEDSLLQEEALNWADRLSQGPTRAYGAIKKLIMQSFEENLNTHLGVEHNFFGATSRTFDFREAIKAFFAGRPPKFSGS